MQTRNYFGTLRLVTMLFALSGAGSALSCYNCGWSADDTCKAKPEVDLKGGEPPPYPMAEKCVGEKGHPPDAATMEASCLKRKCSGRDPACMKWSFLSGSPENITYMCVGNPGNRKGCYTIQIPSSDKEKKYNAKLLKIEVCLCSNKDYCNSSGIFVGHAALVTTVVLIAAFRYNKSSGYS